MFPPAEEEWESDRAIQFVPRQRWERDRRLSDIVERINDIEQDDHENAFDSLPSDKWDNDSVRSFLSILDGDRHIKGPCSGINNTKRWSAGFQERRSLTSTPGSTAPGQHPLFDLNSSRCARDWTPDFTIPTEMERNFLRMSCDDHHLQSETELRFHRHLDRMEAEQRRPPPNFLESSYNEDLPAEDDSMMTDVLQHQSRQEEEKQRQLSPIPESSPDPSPHSTVKEPYIPFNYPLHLARCSKYQAREATGMKMSPVPLTPDRAPQLSPKSIWLSPSPARSSVKRSGTWWVTAPAASESGEVWEEIDEAWMERNGGHHDGEGSTFTAQEEDLDEEDEMVSFVDLKKGSKSKRRWSRCKRMLKCVLRWRR